MKKTKKQPKKTKEVSGSKAIEKEKEKAFKEVFLEETTRNRLRLSMMESKIKDLHDVVDKLRARLGI